MIHTSQNRQFRLAQRPHGTPKPADWEFTTEALRAPAEGEVQVAIEYISLDPAMRGWMNAGQSYIDPVAIGDVMRAGTAGTILESAHPDFEPGDAVTGSLGVQTHATVRGELLRRVDTSLAPLPTYLGALGMPGMTAYFGLLDVGAAQAGDTVLVSAASGAVGALVGQIAKLKGCRTIGIAGGERKCNYIVDELGMDGAIDYKAGNIHADIRTHCPEGVDVYFDNVGGEILDAALACLHRNARVVICGAISQYNATDTIYAPKNYMSLLVNRARMQGFVVFDYDKRYGEAARAIAQWIASGDIKHREDIVEGFEKFPETLLRLFSGDNFGKLVLEIDQRTS